VGVVVTRTQDEHGNITWGVPGWFIVICCSIMIGWISWNSIQTIDNTVKLSEGSPSKWMHKQIYTIEQHVDNNKIVIDKVLDAIEHLQMSVENEHSAKASIDLPEDPALAIHDESK